MYTSWFFEYFVRGYNSLKLIHERLVNARYMIVRSPYSGKYINRLRGLKEQTVLFRGISPMTETFTIEN